MTSQWDGRIGRIGRFQEEVLAVLPQALDCNFFSQEYDDNLARVRGVLLPHDDVVALEDALVDHAISLHSQGEMCALPQESRPEAEHAFLILHCQ